MRGDDLSTFTLLVSVPRTQATPTAPYFADQVKELLERAGYTVAIVDAIHGDRLRATGDAMRLRKAHRAVAGEHYTPA